MKLKKSIIVIWLTTIFIGIAYLFWHKEFGYSLPTPVPKNYKTVNCSDKIIIPQISQLKNDHPLFLYFLDTDCRVQNLIKHIRQNLEPQPVIVAHTANAIESDQDECRMNV